MGGDQDAAGWYSQHGALRRRPAPMTEDEERAKFGYLHVVQQEFMRHVEDGNLHRIEDMLEFRRRDLDVNFQTERDGKTPLFLAAEAGNLELAQVLLEVRADPHIRELTNMRYTPLEVALRVLEDEDKDYAELVEFLREASGYDRLPRVRRSPYGEQYET